MNGLPAHWVTVATFDQTTSAHAARLKLEDEGIDCFIDDENVGGMLWHLSVAVGGIKVKVPESQARQAAEILAGHDMVPDESAGMVPLTEPAADDSVEPATPACPACHSSDTEPFSWGRRLMQTVILFTLAISTGFLYPPLLVLGLCTVVYFLLTKPTYRCLHCGKRWD